MGQQSDNRDRSQGQEGWRPLRSLKVEHQVGPKAVSIFNATAVEVWDTTLISVKRRKTPIVLYVRAKDIMKKCAEDVESRD